MQQESLKTTAGTSSRRGSQHAIAPSFASLSSPSSPDKPTSPGMETGTSLVTQV